MGSKKGQLVFGKHSVIAALYNERRQHDQLMLTPETKQEFEHILRDFPGLRVQVLDRRGLSQIVGVDAVHQGCVLRTSAIEQPVIEDIINAAGENDCVIILDQVTDPHNVGAILRTCAAFGVSAVIQQERHGPEPSNPTLGKTAAGSMEHTPIISVTNIARTMDDLKRANYWCIGLDERGRDTISKMSFTGGRTAFVMGAEGKGLRRLVADNCDLMAKLPTNPDFPTLNVSTAAAVTLYEWCRQNAS